MKQKRFGVSAFIPFIGLVAVVAMLSLLTAGKLLSSNNINIIFNQSFTVMLVAAGATLIYAHGGIDFSLGAVLALSQMCAAMLYRETGLAWILIPASVIAAVVCGFITGLVTIKLKLPPFIASLCMQFACYGVLNTILNTQVIGVAELSMPRWEQTLPILVVAVAIMAILLSFTKIGKYNKAIGENSRAVGASGVNVDAYRMFAYLICGVMLGIAAYYDLLRNGSLTSNTGHGLELNVIIALVLGGMSLSGGYSASIRCAIIGSLIIVIIQNGLILAGLTIQYIGIVQGVIFLAVVLLTYKREKSGLLPR